MKKLLMPLLLCLITSVGMSQVKWGPRIGISTSDLSTGDFDVRQPGSLQALSLSAKDAGYGIQVGAFAQFKIKKLFYFQPEILLNSNKVDFKATHFSEGQTVTDIIREKYQHVEVPMVFGLKLGPLRAGVGPVGKVQLSSTSGITDFEGIKEDFSGLKFGYTANIGLNVGKLILDLKFDRSLSDFGDFLSVDGEPFDFKQPAKRMVFSLGYAF